jgi:hypothetical protein
MEKVRFKKSKIYPKTDKEGYKRGLSLEDAEKYYNNVIKDFNNMNLLQNLLSLFYIYINLGFSLIILIFV